MAEGEFLRMNAAVTGAEAEKDLGVKTYAEEIAAVYPRDASGGQRGDSGEKFDFSRSFREMRELARATKESRIAAANEALRKVGLSTCVTCEFFAHDESFIPATPGLVGRCSISFPSRKIFVRRMETIQVALDGAADNLPKLPLDCPEVPGIKEQLTHMDLGANEMNMRYRLTFPDKVVPEVSLEDVLAKEQKSERRSWVVYDDEVDDPYPVGLNQ